jgi:hypothetical protein
MRTDENIIGSPRRNSPNLPLLLLQLVVHMYNSSLLSLAVSIPSIPLPPVVNVEDMSGRSPAMRFVVTISLFSLSRFSAFLKLVYFYRIPPPSKLLKLFSLL